MRPFIALLLLAIAFSTHAAELHTFELRHRTAAELIPTLQPMLNPGDAITGSGYLLFIRSGNENLAAIEALIERLDQAPQQLFITVEQDTQRDSANSGIGVSGNSREPRVQARLYHNRSDNSGNANQQLRVLEGRWATIRSGTAVPIRTQRTRQYGMGKQVEQHIEYRDVESGFEVRPRLQGDHVILDIRPFHANLSDSGNGFIDEHGISTTVSGRLGQWIEIGGSAESTSENRRGILYSSRGQNRQNHTVRLKVERINH